MASSNSKHPTKHFPLDHSPRMLKDFLTDDSCSSCSSTGFKSFPRNDLNASMLLTSRSKAASTTISVFQTMINAVKKNIHLTAIKSPSLLPRSLSRRLSRSTRSTCRCSESETETQNKLNITVTIKDIIRWKSFRDLNEDKPQPLDLASSPPHCTTASTPCSSYGSNGSSWCDSNFTSEYGNFEEYGDNEVGKKYLRRVGEEEDSMKPKAVGLKAEKHLNSPVSVIDIQFDEDEESSSSFYQSLATVQRTNQNKTDRFERLSSLKKWLMSMEENSSSGEDEATETSTNYDDYEEEAWQLLKHVRETCHCKHNVDRLVLDYFRDELSKKGNQIRNHHGFGCEMVSRVKAWIDGEESSWIEWDRKDAYVKEMEREGKWSKFEDEQEDVDLAIERCILDELLVDLFSLEDFMD